MKKILTLFVMLLCGWSIVSAQTPAFGYQMVVRNADNELVTGTDVTLTIAVLSGAEELYSETKQATTDDLGMLGVLVGTVTPADFAAIDWSVADTISTTVSIDGEDDLVFKTPIQAVPYALQAAKTTLTTDQIVNYLSDPETTIDDYAQIMAAVVANTPMEGEFWQKIKNRVVNYLKNRKDKAVEITAAYLTQASPNDAGTLYSQLTDEVKAKIMDLAKQSAMENKAFAMEVVVAYLPSVTTDDVDDVVQHVTDRIEDALTDDEKTELRAELIQRAVPFAKNHLDLAVSAANYFLGNVTGTQVNSALNVFKSSAMKEAFVDNLFYNYLNYYFRPAIITALVEGHDFSGYLTKQKCGSGTDNHEVDFCSMKRVLNN